MDENKDYLVELDSKAGDGDLGISMSSGFRAVLVSEAMEETSLKKFFMKAGMTINEASPSSLGTILFIAILGGAKAIGDKEELTVKDSGEFFTACVKAVMGKTGSKRGEKTILDSVIPAADVLLLSEDDLEVAFPNALAAAEQGMQATVKMQAVHGRAAYYAEKSIGNIDGGAVVGMLIFKAICDYLSK
ncbi:MAG: dihydroxyacetone kinase subunit L [Clostridia bacterium]|nr:dihydroxyacetone kinase subunit L [Clostridia bacterium]